MARWFTERLLVIVGAAGLAACGGGRVNSPPPRAVGSAGVGQPDSAMPEPPSPARKGVIVPSDTGLGTGPPGMPTSTGTNGRAVGPTLGAPGNNN